MLTRGLAANVFVPKNFASVLEMGWWNRVWVTLGTWHIDKPKNVYKFNALVKMLKSLTKQQLKADHGNESSILT